MRRARAFIALLLLGLPGVVSAHATLVRGALLVEPEPLQPGRPFTLRMPLLDPNEVPIEDAVVVAEFTLPGQERGTARTIFTETEEPGVYLSEPLTLTQPGRYRLLLRDQTYSQEEARAELDFRVGGENPKNSYIFVFPPTATGPGNLRAWLLWLILLPFGAAALVTGVVLLSPPSRKAEPESDAA